MSMEEQVQQSLVASQKQQEEDVFGQDSAREQVHDTEPEMRDSIGLEQQQTISKTKEPERKSLLPSIEQSQGTMVNVQTHEDIHLNFEELAQKESEILSQTEIFLFINSRSANQKKKKFMNLDFDKCQMKFEEVKVKLSVYDIIDVQQKSKGFKKVVQSQKTSKSENIYIIIIGGNGSFASFVEDMVKSKIDVSTLIFSILPFGSQNDLANVLGWGRSPIRSMMQSLRSLAEEILQGEIEEINVWQITIDLQPQGQLMKYDVEHKITKQLEGAKQLSKCMALYFSVGSDARVGLGVDKKKTESRTRNKCIFLCEGFKKFICLRTKKVKDIIAKVIKKNLSPDANDLSSAENDIERGQHEEYKEKILFATGKDEKTDSYLVGNPVSILISNINSYYSCDQWIKCKHLISNTLADGQIGVANAIGELQKPETMAGQQLMDDGVLEISSFSSIINMGMGKSKRVSQTEGPLEVRFRDKCRTYINIDGEFFKLVNPEKITIQLMSAINGKVKVVRRKAGEDDDIFQ